jgi:hypothetical protein
MAIGIARRQSPSARGIALPPSKLDIAGEAIE